jgi:glycosyltransferase involved in cell wall biosynthesis
VQFYVVGQKPAPRVQALANEPGVTITGYVDDVRPYISLASVYVVPLRIGGGTRLKVMEAMAMARPVVSTSVGCEGFPLVSGQHLLIADTPEEFAAAVVGLLKNPIGRVRLGTAARQFVESHCDWQAIVPLLERAYGR